MKIDLILGDCIEKMKDIPDGSVDLVLTDPPYGINLKSYKKLKKALAGDDGMTVMFFLDDILREFKRILKKEGAAYIFSRFDVFPYWWIKCKNYFEMKNCIIWNKGGGGTGDLRGNYFNNYEMIIFFTKGYHKLNGKRIGTLWDFKKPTSVVHPTQKPTELISQIIEKSSNENNTILDPFMGSGTTGIACKNLNRNFLGIELDETYFKIAKERIDNVSEKLL